MKERFREVNAKSPVEICRFLEYLLYFSPLIKRNSREKKMKGLLFAVGILMGAVMVCSIAEAQNLSQVLLIPREGGQPGNLDLMLKKEVGVMRDMLQKAGFKVVVANVSGQPIEGIIKRLKPDLKLSEVKVDDYSGIILACMAMGLFPGPPVSPEAVSIVKQAVAKGKPVAAQTGAVYILAEAGVLKGKRYAFVDDPLNQPPPDTKDIRFVGAIYSGSRVVQDGNIITSGICPATEGWLGMPDCTPELTRAFIGKLSGKK